MRSPTGEGGRAVRCNANELQALGEHLAIAGFDLMGEQKEQLRISTIIDRVHKDCSLAEQVAVLFQNQVANGEHERMAGVKHSSEGDTRLVERPDSLTVKQTRS